MKKNVLERALKTFVEAFIPAIVAALAAADYTDLEMLPRIMTAILISAAATGISAVWNGIIDPLLKRETGATIEISEDDDDGFGEEYDGDK